MDNRLTVDLLSTRYFLRGLDRGHLSLILFPTEQCNFRCVYCYEDFTLGKMPPAVVDGIVRLIEARIPTLRTLELQWFGGEPLAAKDVVFEILSRVNALKAEHAFSLLSGMTTNAWFLDKDTASTLVSLGNNHFQVSLDGDQTSHDLTRVRSNGGGTFSRIWKNLLALKETLLGLTCLLRVHVHMGNIASVVRLIHALNDKFSGDERFKIIIHPVDKLTDVKFTFFESLSQRAEVVSSLKQFIDKSLVFVDHDADNYVCYAGQPNSLVIRSNGDVAKCTVALGSDKNRIGKISADGTLSIDGGKHRPWLRGLSTLDADTLACPAIGLVEDPGPPLTL